MKTKLLEHFLGILLVTLLMVGILAVSENRTTHENRRQRSRIQHLLDAPVTRFNDPFERHLLADCMDIFYPGRHDENRALVEELLHIKEREFNRSMQSSYQQKKLSLAAMIDLSGMYLKFLIIYIIVMALTWYGVQTLGSLRFILRQQQLHRTLFERQQRLRPAGIIIAAGKTAAYFVLFSPAYVIAYSIRTEFNTDSAVFMVLLGVISNGLLVMYTNKFYTFLVAESRRGYVENALVKNLRSDYVFGASGIPLRAVFGPKKRFSGHVFEHIFRNARYQYLPTIKEQASFLITGLIIIEMALNIHGHLAYELLRQILYKNHVFVVIIMLLIFYTVKSTEIVADLLVNRESKRYEN